MNWLEALKHWNKSQTSTRFVIPRKDTAQYREVKNLMGTRTETPLEVDEDGWTAAEWKKYNDSLKAFDKNRKKQIAEIHKRANEVRATAKAAKAAAKKAV